MLTAQSTEVVAASHVVEVTVPPATNARAEFVTVELLLVIGNLREDRGLDLVNCFGFLFFLGHIHGLTCRVNQPSSDKDDKVTFDMLLGIAPEEPADNGHIPNDRGAILGFLHIFPH
jgi:hypothetical protein